MTTTPFSFSAKHDRMSETACTDADTLVRDLWRTFTSGRTGSEAWRRAQLDGVARFLVDREQELLAAMREDLGKPQFEAYTTDIAFVLGDIRLARKRLHSWMVPRRLRTPLRSQPARTYLHPEPKGVALILGTWNYPLATTLLPLVGAVAAGNCTVVKPSEVAPATATALARLAEYVDPQCIRIVLGGAKEAGELLQHRFGHILYTGSARVGRIVMEAAARHLTPVTLELGGKSPVYVHRDADIALAARRIAWGKFYNAGQSCIAPDYVLAHEAIEAELVEQLCTVIRRFYGDDPRSSADYGRIVNAQHLDRIARLLDGPADVAIGGQIDPGDLYMAPTVLRDVSADDPVMQEEIFGPILPVLRVGGREEASTFINQRPTPLAVYVFSRARNVCAAFARSTPAGGVCTNHVLVHALNQALPFGGLGESGLGAYTGRHSFDTFTHWKPVMEAGTWPDVPILYPPYTDRKRAWVRRLLG